MGRRATKRRATKRRVVNKRRKSMRIMRGGDFESNVKFTSGFAEDFVKRFRSMIDSNEIYRQNIKVFLSLGTGNFRFSVDDLMNVEKLKEFSFLWSKSLRDQYKDELEKLGWDRIGLKYTKVLKFFEAVGKGTIKSQ